MKLRVVGTDIVSVSTTGMSEKILLKPLRLVPLIAGLSRQRQVWHRRDCSCISPQLCGVRELHQRCSCTYPACILRAQR